MRWTHRRASELFVVRLLVQALALCGDSVARLNNGHLDNTAWIKPDVNVMTNEYFYSCKCCSGLASCAHVLLCWRMLCCPLCCCSGFWVCSRAPLCHVGWFLDLHHFFFLPLYVMDNTGRLFYFYILVSRHKKNINTHMLFVAVCCCLVFTLMLTFVAHVTCRRKPTWACAPEACQKAEWNH